MLFHTRHAEGVAQCSHPNDELVVAQRVPHVLAHNVFTHQRARRQIRRDGVRQMKMIRSTEPKVAHWLDDGSMHGGVKFNALPTDGAAEKLSTELKSHNEVKFLL